LVEMLAAVELDDQPCLQANEVAHIGADRTLAAEAEAVDATATEVPLQGMSLFLHPSAGKVARSAGRGSAGDDDRQPGGIVLQRQR
jgi:hypothetical protein